MRQGRPDEQAKMIDQLGKETRALIQHCLELSWYSRSTDYHGFLQMSAFERDVASQFLSKRLEAESKKMYPIY